MPWVSGSEGLVYNPAINLLQGKMCRGPTKKQRGRKHATCNVDANSTPDRLIVGAISLRDLRSANRWGQFFSRLDIYDVNNFAVWQKCFSRPKTFIRAISLRCLFSVRDIDYRREKRGCVLYLRRERMIEF